MTNEHDSRSDLDYAITQAAVEKKTTPSIVWLLPFIALLIGVWLAYQYYTERGTEIMIHLPYGSDIKAGETELRFEGMHLGLVQSVSLAKDLSGIDAVVLVDKKASMILQPDTLFWLVKPKVTISQITGLDTLVSGNYLTFQMGDITSELNRDKLMHLSPTKFEYTALSEPPNKPQYFGGLQFTILSDHPATIAEGAPVSYKKITIGRVERIDLAEDKQTIKYRIFIDKKYKQLITTHSRFYNSSGIEFHGSLDNINVSVDSLTSVLIGGISLLNDATQINLPQEKINKDHEFKLYADEQAAKTAGSFITVRFLVDQEITLGMPLKYKGISLGEVNDINLDEKLQFIDATIKLFDYYNEIAKSGSKFWLVEAELNILETRNLDTLIKGKHIAVDLGKGSPQQHFVALAKAPIEHRDNGKVIKLVSDRPTSITKNSAVTYNKVIIGKVQQISLAKNGELIYYHLYIEQPYTHLLTKQTRFWESSGINLKGNLSNLELNVGSLSNILIGGIALENPKGITATETVKQGHPYTLYATRGAAFSEQAYISIRFETAENLSENMPLRYNGIQVGQVESLTFADNMKSVFAKVRIDEHMASIARDDAIFWVVKPELGLTNTRNITTLLTGNYLSVKLGQGEARYDFIAANHPPEITTTDSRPLKIILLTERLGSIKQGVKLYYRNIVIGEVDGTELATDARQVLIHASIEKRYMPLIRTNTRFWSISGLSVDFGLLSGLEVDTRPFEALLEGGIALATPDNDEMGEPVSSGAAFPLAIKVKEQWLKWSPKIAIGE